MRVSNQVCTVELIISIEIGIIWSYMVIWSLLFKSKCITLSLHLSLFFSRRTYIKINVVLKHFLWLQYIGESNSNCHVGIKGFVWKTNEFSALRWSIILPTYKRSYVILAKQSPFAELVSSEKAHKIQQCVPKASDDLLANIIRPSIIFQTIFPQ